MNNDKAASVVEAVAIPIPGDPSMVRIIRTQRSATERDMSPDEKLILSLHQENEQLRAELASPLVAPVEKFGPDEDGIVWPKPAMTTPSPNLAEYFSAPQVRAIVAATRPQVVRAEPVTDAEVIEACAENEVFLRHHQPGEDDRIPEGGLFGETTVADIRGIYNYLASRTAPAGTVPTQAPSNAVPVDVFNVAISFKENGYRGPLVWAQKVFDWVVEQGRKNG